MTYSKEILTLAREQLERQKAAHESRQLAREQEIYAKLPRVREIDVLLRSSMAKAVQAAFLKGTDAKEALTQIKAQNLALQEERKALIAAHFPAEYLEDGPLCPHCGGAGGGVRGVSSGLQNHGSGAAIGHGADLHLRGGDPVKLYHKCHLFYVAQRRTDTGYIPV